MTPMLSTLLMKLRFGRWPLSFWSKCLKARTRTVSSLTWAVDLTATLFFSSRSKLR